MNITKKRLFKIKKTKNQSRKRIKKSKKKTRRKKRSFRRKRKKYNLKNRSVKKYSKKKYGGATGDEKNVFFLMPILKDKNSLTNDWQPTHNGIGAYSSSNPTFQLAQMTLTENDNGQWEMLPQVDTGVQRPGYVPKGYRPSHTSGSTFANSLFLHDHIGDIDYGGLQAPQNTITVLFQLFNAILIRHQIRNTIGRPFLRGMISRLLGEGTTENPYKTKEQFIDDIIFLANNGTLPNPNQAKSEGSHLNLPNIPSTVEENTRYDNVEPTVEGDTSNDSVEQSTVDTTNVAEKEEDSDSVNTGSVVISSDDGGKDSEAEPNVEPTNIAEQEEDSDSVNTGSVVIPSDDGGNQQEESASSDDSTNVIPPSSSNSINSDDGGEEEVSNTENKDEEPTFSVVYIKPTGGTVVLKMPTSTLYNDLIQTIRSNPDVTVEENDLLLEYVNEVSGTPNQYGDIPIEITNIADYTRFKDINPIPTLNAFSLTMRYRQYQDVIDSVPAPVEPLPGPQIDTVDEVGGEDDPNASGTSIATSGSTTQTGEENTDTVGEEDDANASGASIATSGSTTQTEVDPNTSESSIASGDGGEKIEEKSADEGDDGVPDEDGGDDENPELGASSTSSSSLSTEDGSEEIDPTLGAHDVSYPYLIVHAQARPGPYQPELDAHIHTRGGVDADEWIQYSMLPGLTGGRKKKKRNNKGKSRKKHRRRSKSKSFKKKKRVY